MKAPKPLGDGCHIVCRGSRIQVPFRVRTWAETGLKFESVRNRTVTKLVINHATGAENPPARVVANMSERLNAYGNKSPLSVHFIVDQRGYIYQTADTEAYCVHAGHANGYSIGIEYVCRLSDYGKVPARGIERMRVSEYIHGVEVVYDELLPKQVEAGVRLNEALCRLYALPVCVPETEVGTAKLDELSTAELVLFSGCGGHLHVHPTKVDPGAKLLRAIQARGKELRAQGLV